LVIAEEIITKTPLMQFTRQSQSQNQKQGYYLSIQHMQFMHLLHLSGYALDEYLQNQLEENPLLELNENDPDKELVGEADTLLEKEKQDVFDEEFFEEEYPGDYEKNYSSSGSEEDVYQSPVVQFETFTEQLKNQIDLMNITEEQKTFSKYIIDELDDDGYLRRTNAEIANDYGFRCGKIVDEAEVEKILKIVQQCEPAGIAARNLQECLLLQLNSKESSSTIEIAKLVLRDHYNKYVNHNFQDITSALDISPEIFKEVTEIIHTLYPKPNTSIDKYELFKNQITPAFEVTYDGNEFNISIVNSKYCNLSIIQNAEELNKNTTRNIKTIKSEKKYWTKMVNEAYCLVEAVKQREKTMMTVINSILKLQLDFFKYGDKKLLKPMVLEQVAALSGCDISTVSRITSNKYVQTSYGCFLLKNLFSSSLQAGEEQVSSHKVKELIEEIIKKESKDQPLTDNQIVESLKEMGISIARRTVVKYRDIMGIPNYSMRIS
jgi:RNA polymerase sigma-54 factor